MVDHQTAFTVLRKIKILVLRSPVATIDTDSTVSSRCRPPPGYLRSTINHLRTAKRSLGQYWASASDAPALGSAGSSSCCMGV